MPERLTAREAAEYPAHCFWSDFLPGLHRSGSGAECRRFAGPSRPVWNKESHVLTGMKARRLGCLLDEQISLLAYHLPLDAHPEIGNNARLAILLPVEQ